MDEISWQEMVEKKQEIYNHVSYSEWVHTHRWYHRAGFYKVLSEWDDLKLHAEFDPGPYQGDLFHMWCHPDTSNNYLPFDKWYESYFSIDVEILAMQDDPLHIGNPVDLSWINNESFIEVTGNKEVPLCMPCVISPNSKMCKAMVAQALPLAPIHNVMLHFDTCASHMSTPFKQDFTSLDEDNTSGTLD